MFAIIKTGGKQYQVKEGQTITVEKLPQEAHQEVKFDDVFMVGEEDGASIKIGTPTVEGASVVGKVVEQVRARKVRVEKFKAKVRYHKVYGHRQHQTKVKIEKISVS